MTTYNYCILANSTGTLIKRFKIQLSGYREQKLKRVRVESTLDGKDDITLSSIKGRWMLPLRVPHTVSDSNYGTRADLETLFNLNDPGATPSNIITFTDNYGVPHTVVITSNLDPSLLGVEMEGLSATFIYMVELLEVDVA